MSACTFGNSWLSRMWEGTKKQSSSAQENSTVRQSSSEKYPWKSAYSNLNNQKCREEVKSLLAADLDKDSVDNFVNLVNDCVDLSALLD